MILEMHVNGKDNPGKITYQNENKEWLSIAVPDIAWVFQSTDPIKKEPGDMKGTENKAGNEHYLYIMKTDGSVFTFTLPQTDIEQFFSDIHQANPDIIIGALKGRRIELEKLPNTRDLGGLKTADNRFVLPHKLIRSGALHDATHEDKEILEKDYDLKEVVDFRTDWERAAQPDPIWLFIKHVHDPIYHESETGLTPEFFIDKDLEEISDEIPDLLEKTYRNMVLSQQGIKGWKKFFELLEKHDEGSLLFHCTQGKDRTGLAAALLLEALGVDRDTILADYEQTTPYLAYQLNDALNELSKETGKPREEFVNVDMLFEAPKKLIEISYKAIDDTYGNTQNYLSGIIGLSPERIENLKNKYLSKPAQ